MVGYSAGSPATTSDADPAPVAYDCSACSSVYCGRRSIGPAGSSGTRDHPARRLCRSDGTACPDAGARPAANTCRASAVRRGTPDWASGRDCRGTRSPVARTPTAADASGGSPAGRSPAGSAGSSAAACSGGSSTGTNESRPTDCVGSLIDPGGRTIDSDETGAAGAVAEGVPSASCARPASSGRGVLAFGQWEAGSYACPCPCAGRGLMGYPLSCPCLGVSRRPTPSPLAYCRSRRPTSPCPRSPRYHRVACVACFVITNIIIYKSDAQYYKPL